MKPVGYALIKTDQKSGISPAPMTDFVGKPVRVLEFAEDGGVMVINNEATAIATFDKQDVRSSFKCNQFGNVLVPEHIKIFSAAGVEFLMKRQSRKGGYCQIIQNMVIAASLQKGEFYDDFLFQKQ